MRITICLLFAICETGLLWGQTLQKTDIFPFQSQHVHGSSIVALPDQSLLCVWFQGSGERQADDVAIWGARFKGKEWSEPFLMADVAGFPDINPVIFLDPQQRLWLIWYTVMANQWESSLLRYRISESYMGKGAPQWSWQDVILLKPGGKTEQGIQPTDSFVLAVTQKFDQYYTYLGEHGGFDQLPVAPEEGEKLFWERVSEIKFLAAGKDWVAKGMGPDSSGTIIRKPMGYPRFRRIGWQSRNKPLFLESGRMILPLYADGFDFSLMAITDNGGKSWECSEPLVSIGGVQPTLLAKKDGSIYTLMRDNGPPPQRLLTSISKDEGKHWSPVVDSKLLNPGSGCDMVQLQDGRWVLANNDTADGRHKLSLYLSEDEGKNWTLWQKVESHPKGTARAHYPAIIQDQEGKIHLSYSFHTKDQAGNPLKTIRHAIIHP